MNKLARMDELSQKIQQLQLTFTEIPFARMLGLQLLSCNESSAEMGFANKPELIGNYLYGILHGGVISSVLDMVGGMVVMTHAVYKYSDKSMEDLGKILGRCSTVDLQISYLRPGKGENFIAKATILKHGSKISFTRMELLNEQGELIATGTGTYTHP